MAVTSGSREALPDRGFTKKVFTHKLKDLIGLAGLRSDFERARSAISKLGGAWNAERDWNEQSCYLIWDAVGASMRREWGAGVCAAAASVIATGRLPGLSALAAIRVALAGEDHPSGLIPPGGGSSDPPPQPMLKHNWVVRSSAVHSTGFLP